MGDVAPGARQDLPHLLPWGMEGHQITTPHSVPCNFTPPWVTIPNASLTFQPSTFAADYECTTLQCTDPSIAPSLPDRHCSKAQAQLAVHLHVKPSNTFINPFFFLSNSLHYSYRNNKTYGICDCAHGYFFLVFGLDEIM